MLPLKDNIPTRRFPVLTVLLIAANIIVFFVLQDATLSLGGAVIDNGVTLEYGAIPYELTNPGSSCQVAGGAIECEPDGGDSAPTWLTVLVSMFMHGGLLHLGFNMLFLWIFGNNVEDSMSRWRFIAFYLLGGLGAMALQVAVAPDSTAPLIGASGAIAAVLGGYAMLYPRARVVTLMLIIFFVTLVELPALLVLGLWIVIQLALGIAELGSQVGQGGVAYFAHIGGFAVGLLAIRAFANRPHKDYLRGSRTAVY